MTFSAQRRTYRLTGERMVAVAVCALFGSCAQMQMDQTSNMQESPVATTMQSGSDQRRIEALEREVERLKLDLVHAEDALTIVESRVRNGHSRAKVVSSLAEARIELSKTLELVPWRSSMIEQAQAKLDIAQIHINQESFGTAMFFVYRANRIVEELNNEGDVVRQTPETMFINRPRVNLRSGPSTNREIVSVLMEGTPIIREDQRGDWVLVRTLDGLAGWIHRSLATSKKRYIGLT